MISISFTIFGSVFIMLLIFVYFFKEKINTLENKIYSMLIITSFFSSIIEIINFLLVYNGIASSSILYLITIKLLFTSFLVWLGLFTSYNVVVGRKLRNKKIDDLKKYLYIYFAVIVFNLILPINIVEVNNLLLPQGVGVNVLYFLAFSCILIIMISLMLNRNFLKNKKYIPLYMIVILFGVTIIIQNINEQLFLINPVLIFITFLMYFTIENPDVKMLEEVTLAKEQADKANAAKTDFLSNMSHEIRTPLNAIVGFSQNLYEEDIPDTAKDQVKDIITASNNLLELVNGILDISKIEANKLEIINDEYSFKRVFDELCSLTHARIGDKDLIFKTSYDESIPNVLYGDKLRIKQVILNILTNSVKYTKKGFVEFKISSIIKEDVCRLIISVEDSGIGIKQENIEKLFTKFQRFEERNSTIEGIGLGLAITKKLVELMNGQIIVQSVYGQGSKFTIALDQRIIKNPTIDLDYDNKITLDSETYDLTGKKVLVVDDNNLNLKVASKLLAKYNLTVELITNGRECLDKITSGATYDLILLDDMMPKMSGVETFIELKKIEGFNIPTVILTANAISGMREKYLKDGFDDYLAKPIDKGELNRVLTKFVRNKE